MTVIYRRFDGKPVSAEWHTVLLAARAAGVQFALTSGHRTLAEQQALYDLYRSGRGNLAAKPNRNAPHIRVGRIDHAIDVNALDGGAARLATWLRRRGLRVTFPVPGEAWHIEAPSAVALRRVAQALADPLADYPADERAAIRQYDDWVRRGVNPAGRQRLRREMAAMATRIEVAARKSGWGRLNRRARHRSLTARS